MHVGKKTQKREKSAMTLSLYGSLVFAIVEIGMAVFSGSQAVIPPTLIYDKHLLHFHLDHVYRY